MQHAPVGNPYAGASVPKVVYVSRNTPIMAAVKRIRKLLLQVEKRAMKNVKLVDGKGGDKEKMGKIAEGSKNAKEEKIYVKATGMAMEQALRVGQWFKEKEWEMPVDVEIKTGSVIVVDDIVEKEEPSPTELGPAATAEAREELSDVENMEVDAKDDSTAHTPSPQLNEEQSSGSTHEDIPTDTANINSQAKVEGSDAKEVSASAKKARSRASRRKKKRPAYGEDEVPEARTRWVKMVEIAISLKG